MRSKRLAFVSQLTPKKIHTFGSVRAPRAPRYASSCVCVSAGTEIRIITDCDSAVSPWQHSLPASALFMVELKIEIERKRKEKCFESNLERTIGWMMKWKVFRVRFQDLNTPHYSVNAFNPSGDCVAQLSHDMSMLVSSHDNRCWSMSGRVAASVSVFFWGSPWDLGPTRWKQQSRHCCLLCWLWFINWTCAYLTVP